MPDVITQSSYLVLRVLATLNLRQKGCLQNNIIFNSALMKSKPLSCDSCLQNSNDVSTTPFLAGAKRARHGFRQLGAEG